MNAGLNPLSDSEENNLKAPYILKIGSKLAIPRSQYHQVKAGDTLYSISREYQMSVSELITLNDLKAPHQVNLGQKIRISNNKIAQREVMLANSSSQDRKDTQRSSFVERVLDNRKNRFIWPTKGSVISDFGPKIGGLYNDGINIKTTQGEPIKAAEEGIVAYVGNELKGYGNLIILKHSDGWITAYGHLSKAEVRRGEKVGQAQTIAYAGSTGNVDSSQLYFGLRKGRDAVNPQNYLKN